MDKNEIKYRQALETDAEAIVSLDESRYGLGKALSIFYVKDCCKLYSETLIIAEVEQKIVGFCIGLSSRTNETGWISAVTVSIKFKGRKIGEKLVNQVCHSLKVAGCSGVALTVEPNLLLYYENLGFVKKSSKLNDYYGKNENRYILFKQF